MSNIQIPESLLTELASIKQFDREKFIEVHQQNPSVSIRWNTEKKQSEKDGAPVPWCENAYYLPERPFFTFDPIFHGGAYYVQEASSMFIWEILKNVFPDRNAEVKVLDLCAAPGGKTTLLGSYFKNGLVVGNEIIKSRANILVENTSKWGTGNFIVSNNDPKQFAGLKDYFDVILVDAPCSGSGLFRKEPSWREEWTEANVDLCSERQQRILADIYPALKKDGILIYSTCSYSVKEDEAILDWFSADFEVENLKIPLNENWGIVETNSKSDQVGYRFFPDKLDGEGFFAAVFRKKESSGYTPFLGGKYTQPNKMEVEIVQKWLVLGDYFFFKIQDSIHCIAKKWQADVELLHSKLYLKKAGTEVGEVKKDLVPAHELALSIHLNRSNCHVFELNTEQSLQYLRKNNLERLPEMENGWTLITHSNVGLGWIKALPNRINNYYPTEWRILKQ
ncbi:methyltransferase RsmF C-terminal domain-like protein [Rhizosphaericola mali]|uniref:RNA methyltransferase n=1 Tax=Rhizosphaericola mali TaxID=2545455 RepID=A0A5P2G3P4_9BACT|nr:RNA methyltransferase [Rhizosphaericola mali]QES87713.1 RNA methyltransferase [Rhizosphaericola mali]